MDNSLAAFRDYLQLEKNYSAHTVTAYIKDVEKFGEFVITEFEIEDLRMISYAQVRSWIVKLVEAGISKYFSQPQDFFFTIIL